MVAGFDLYFAELDGFMIHGCVLFQKGKGSWFSFPAKAIDDQENPGKKKYLQHCRFDNREAHDRLADKIIPKLYKLIETAEMDNPPKPIFDEDEEVSFIF